MTEEEIRRVLRRYLDLLQRHPTAEEMMEGVLTDDFETGFVGGFMWRGLEGMRDFLSQRRGFFDELHEVQDVLSVDTLANGDLEVKTRLHFFLRRWQDPSPTSDEFTGFALHTWWLREVGAEWRVAAQLVDGFEDLNENAKRLFSTPDEGLNE